MFLEADRMAVCDRYRRMFLEADRMAVCDRYRRMFLEADRMAVCDRYRIMFLEADRMPHQTGRGGRKLVCQYTRHEDPLLTQYETLFWKDNGNLYREMPALDCKHEKRATGC
jgi:hypothetical protein